MYTLVDGHRPPSDIHQWRHVIMIETEVGIAIKITLSAELTRHVVQGIRVYFQSNIKILPILGNKICNYVIWEMKREYPNVYGDNFEKAFIRGFPLALNDTIRKVTGFMSKMTFRVILPDTNFTDKITDINISDIDIPDPANSDLDKPVDMHIQFQNYNDTYLTIIKEYDKGKSCHMVELGVISKHPCMDCYYYHNGKAKVGTKYSDNDIMATMDRKYGVDAGTVYLKTVCDAITEGLSKKEKTV